MYALKEKLSNLRKKVSNGFYGFARGPGHVVVGVSSIIALTALLTCCGINRISKTRKNLEAQLIHLVDKDGNGKADVYELKRVCDALNLRVKGDISSLSNHNIKIYLELCR